MPKTLKSYQNKKKAKSYRNRHRNKNYEEGGYIRKKGEYAPPWTDEEDEIMTTMTKEGKMDREIAEILERPVRGIQKRRHRLKVQNMR